MTLSQILRSNATFSLLTGLGLAIMPDYFSRIFQFENELPFRILGFLLLFFAATVFYASVNPHDKPRQVRWIIIQDALWVIGSAIIIAFQFFSFSSVGYWLIANVALIVAFFGFFQFRKL